MHEALAGGRGNGGRGEGGGDAGGSEKPIPLLALGSVSCSFSVFPSFLGESSVRQSLFLSVCLCVCVFVPVRLSVCPSVCPSFCPPAPSTRMHSLLLPKHSPTSRWCSSTSAPANSTTKVETFQRVPSFVAAHSTVVCKQVYVSLSVGCLELIV